MGHHHGTGVHGFFSGSNRDNAIGREVQNLSTTKKYCTDKPLHFKENILSPLTKSTSSGRGRMIEGASSCEDDECPGQQGSTVIADCWHPKIGHTCQTPDPDDPT